MPSPPPAAAHHVAHGVEVDGPLPGARRGPACRQGLGLAGIGQRPHGGEDAAEQRLCQARVERATADDERKRKTFLSFFVVVGRRQHSVNSLAAAAAAAVADTAIV